jgi:MFS family permease
MSMFGVGAIGAAFIGGHLADTIGRKPVLMGSLVFAAAVWVVFPFLQQEWSILTGCFLFSLLGETYRPAAGAMITDVTPPERRTDAYVLMYYAINLGMAVAAVSGGLIAEALSYSWVFWIDAITCSGFAILILLAIRETMPNSKVEVDRPVDGKERVPLGRALSHIVHDKVFVVYALAVLISMIVYTQHVASLALYLKRNSESLGFVVQEGGSIAKEFGWLVAINGTMIVLFQLPITSVAQRFDRGTVMAVGAMVIGIGYGATALATNIVWVGVTIAIWTIGEMIQTGFTFAIVSDLAPENMRARYMGAIAMSFSLGVVIGSPSAGWIIENWGGNYVWGGCLLLGVAAATLFLAIRRQVAVRPQT